MTKSIALKAYEDFGAGDLDKRVIIRRREDRAIGYSSITQSYSDVRKRWASLKPVGTSVWASSLQTEETVTHRAVIRFMEGIGIDHELVYAGVVYRVKRSAPLDGGRVFLIIELEELGSEEAVYGTS